MASGAPQRIYAGFTQANSSQPQGHMGCPDPFFYHQFSDDFNVLDANVWTTTVTTTGTVAGSPGDGGLVVFTTNNSTPLATDIASIQVKNAGFGISVGQRMIFLTRLQVSGALPCTFMVGLASTTTTPFSATDGLFFYKATGAATLVLRNKVGATITDLTIPAAAVPLADNTYIDLGFYIDRNGQVNAFVDSKLSGFIPQSGMGSSTPARGPVASFSPTLPTNVLNVTLALQSGTASSKQMIVDYVMAAEER